jgi:hypothetical protein
MTWFQILHQLEKASWNMRNCHMESDSWIVLHLLQCFILFFLDVVQRVCWPFPSTSQQARMTWFPIHHKLEKASWNIPQWMRFQRMRILWEAFLLHRCIYTNLI